MTTTATTQASDLTHGLQFLLAHPELPTPRGVDVGYIGGDLSVTACLDTAEQVQVWADALGLPAERHESPSATHHTVHTFEPFYVSVTAIIPVGGAS